MQTARDSAQFSVYHKGVLVVNLAGGYADDEAGWTMGRDTLLFTASTIKAVSAFCIALLVDRYTYMGGMRHVTWRQFLGLLSWYPFIIVKSLQLFGTTISWYIRDHVNSPHLISRSGTRKWNLQVPDPQMSYSDSTKWLDTTFVATVLANNHFTLMSSQRS